MKAPQAQKNFLLLRVFVVNLTFQTGKSAQKLAR